MTHRTDTETLVNALVTRALNNPVPMISPRGVHVIVPPSLAGARLAAAYVYCADKGCRHSALVNRA